MDASQLKKLSEAYASISEGGKHEKSAMNWNKKDDNPEEKKVDKKKVDNTLFPYTTLFRSRKSVV